MAKSTRTVSSTPKHVLKYYCMKLYEKAPLNHINKTITDIVRKNNRLKDIAEDAFLYKRKRYHVTYDPQCLNFNHGGYRSNSKIALHESLYPEADNLIKFIKEFLDERELVDTYLTWLLTEISSLPYAHKYLPTVLQNVLDPENALWADAWVLRESDEPELSEQALNTINEMNDVIYRRFMLNSLIEG